MGFGHRMRLMRVHRSVSQAELEKRIGLNQSVISRIESELIFPNADLEQRIREALKWDEEAERGLAILEGQSEKEPA